MSGRDWAVWLVWVCVWVALVGLTMPMPVPPPPIWRMVLKRRRPVLEGRA